jgi:cytochrome oxidase assembly protein ShyY1
MNPAILQQPFVQITLPVVIGFVAVGVWQNRRLDDIIHRLARIEAKLDDHSERIVRVEERTSPLTRRGA